MTEIFPLKKACETCHHQYSEEVMDELILNLNRLIKFTSIYQPLLNIHFKDSDFHVLYESKVMAEKFERLIKDAGYQCCLRGHEPNYDGISIVWGY